MVTTEYNSELHSFVDTWTKVHNTTWDALLKSAEPRLSPSVGTDIRKGSMPKPDSVRRLADAMKVSRGKLFLLAGYLSKEDVVVTENVELGAEEEELVTGYQHLPEEGRKWLLRSLRGMLGFPA